MLAVRKVFVMTVKIQIMRVSKLTDLPERDHVHPIHVSLPHPVSRTNEKIYKSPVICKNVQSATASYFLDSRIRINKTCANGAINLNFQSKLSIESI